MKPDEIPDMGKIKEYLEKYDEICDFVIYREAWKKLRSWISMFLLLISLLGLFGGKAYIDYVVKDSIEKRIANAIDQEKSYFKERNELIYKADLAIYTADVSIYESLREIERNPERDIRIRTAANVEGKRIQLFFSNAISDRIVPCENITYNDESGNISKGYDISTDNLIRLFQSLSNATNLGERTTILSILSTRSESNLPRFLFETARNTNHLRIRWMATVSLGTVMKDFPEDQFDYKYFEDKLAK